MKRIINKVPLPLSGVMLGTAALGNLLQSYSEAIRYGCGAVAGILFLALLLKAIICPRWLGQEMKNPIMASVAGTFPMGLMILTTYGKPWIGKLAFYIWILAVALHVALILYFTWKFMLRPQLPKVFASYFIVYVGIVTASITGPAYGQQAVGAATFWFGFVTLVLLLALVTYRYWKLRLVPDQAKPLICIYGAPASLCVAGYVQSVAPKSDWFLMALLLAATAIYLFSLVKALACMKLPFYPSYASFTFPFVISAIAVKQAMASLGSMGRPVPVLKYLVFVETVVAAVFVVYTLIRFLMFLMAGEKPKAAGEECAA